jgi:hypothetical protein
MGARIEGRRRPDGRGADNGKLHCTKWRDWSITAKYTDESEPIADKREHTVRIVLDPIGTLVIIVDEVPLVLDAGSDWEFNPKGKLGFLTELGGVTVADLEVKPR